MAAALAGAAPRRDAPCRRGPRRRREQPPRRRRGDPAVDRKDRQNPVADELEHFSAEGVNCAGDAVEPSVERRNDLRRRMALGERGEIAQVRIEECGGDGLAFISPQRRGEHARRAAPAEIGFERRLQGRTLGERSDRRRRKAGRLAEVAGLARCERTRAHPGESRRIRLAPDRVLLHGARRDAREPSPPSLAWGNCCGHASRGEAQTLDDLAAPGAPQPGPPGDQGVWDIERQGAARERQAIGDEVSAELGEQVSCATDFGGLIDKPGERRVHSHRPDHGLEVVPLSRAMPISGLSLPGGIHDGPPRRPA